MNTVDLTCVEATCFRPVAGPGTPLPDVGFDVRLAHISGDASVVWEDLPEATERVLYAASGSGSIIRDGEPLELGELQVRRLTGDLSTPPELKANGDLVVLALSSKLTPPEETEDIADLNGMEGIRFPALRWGRSITNGTSPIETSGFTCGLSILAPRGGQVPWHNHPDRQNELYIVLSGRAQMCVGDQVREIASPGAVTIPGDRWHQITNVHTEEPLSLIYSYEGSVAAPHWWQERDGVLPPAGEQENPPLPEGAFPQCTVVDSEKWKEIAEKQF